MMVSASNSFLPGWPWLGHVTAWIAMSDHSL